MAVKQFYHDIDLVNVGQLIGARIQNVTTAERNSLGTTFTNGTPTDHIGLQVWDTTIDAPYVWDGSQWVRDALVVNGDIVFQGTVDATSSLDAQATAAIGNQYAVSVAGTLSMTGVTFNPTAVVEVGDMVLFTSGTEATVLQRNLDGALVDADFASAGIMATNGSGTYSIITDNSANWNAAYNDKINSASFNTTDGVLTLTQQDGGTVTVDLDGRYLTEQIAEVNDLTASVTWANVPDANITQSSVIQHESLLSINESQINFTSSFIELTDLSVGAPNTASGSGAISYENTTGVFTYTPPDLSSYLTAETNDLTASVTWANVPDANITQTSVIQHESLLSINESQISLTNSLAAGFTATDLSGAVNELEGEINALQGRDEVATYTATGISITGSTPFTVNHNLALSDKDFFTIRVCDSNGSSISVDVDSVNTNSLTLTSLVDLTGIKVFIIGVPA